MRKMSLMLLVLGAFLLNGCQSDMNKKGQVLMSEYVEEICYDGYVYVQFYRAQSAWGAVKYPPEQCSEDIVKN